MLGGRRTENLKPVTLQQACTILQHESWKLIPDCSPHAVHSLDRRRECVSCSWGPGLQAPTQTHTHTITSSQRAKTHTHTHIHTQYHTETRGRWQNSYRDAWAMAGSVLVPMEAMWAISYIVIVTLSIPWVWIHYMAISTKSLTERLFQTSCE